MASYPSILDEFTPYNTVIDLDHNKIEYANIGCNKVVVKDKSLFEPVKIKMRNGPLIIHGKRWYFRLVRSDTYNRSRALMDDYNLNQISHHLVVCFTPDKLPGNDKPFRTLQGEPVRIYGFFDSYIEFYEYLQNFVDNEKAFYEIIFGEFPQKPHFDIDINLDDVNAKFPGCDIDIISDELKDCVISACIELCKEQLCPIDIERDILIYSSHTIDKKKRSLHIVITNKCHDDNKDSKAFYDAVMTKVHNYTNNKYNLPGINFIDKAVYSPRQQFRIVGSQKIGSNRPKIFYETFTYQGKKYKHIYPEDVSDINLKKLTIIYESLIGFTSGCRLLPSLAPLKVYNQNNLGSMPDIDQKTIDYCMTLLKQKMKLCPFTIKEVKGHLILLKRHGPSYCPICHPNLFNKGYEGKRDLENPHEKEHPYIYITNGKIYWDCRRSSSHKNKFLIGYLDIPISDNFQEIDDNDYGGDFIFGDTVISSNSKQLDTPHVSVPPITERIQNPESVPPISQRIQNPENVLRKISDEVGKKKDKESRYVPVLNSLNYEVEVKYQPKQEIVIIEKAPVPTKI